MNRQELNEMLLVKICMPLSSRGDLSTVGDILTVHKAKNILELGVGNADWLIFAAAVLHDSSVNLTGYENFTWKFEDHNWASTLEELNKSNKQRLLQLKLTNIIQIKHNDIENLSSNITDFGIEKYDIVRLDCLCDTVLQIDTVIDSIMPYTSENCIFLVDDITPSYCPNRFLSFMDKVRKKELKPLWFGEHEGAWVKPSFNTIKFGVEMEKYFADYWYSGENTNREFYGANYSYFTSRPKNVGCIH